MTDEEKTERRSGVTAQRKRSSEVTLSTVDMTSDATLENGEQTQPSICRICGKEVIAREIKIDHLWKLDSAVQVDEENATVINDKFKCRLCEETTEYKSGIISHVLQHIKQNEIYYCEICQDWINKLEEGFDNDSLPLQRFEKKQIIEMPELVTRRRYTRSGRVNIYFHNFINSLREKSAQKIKRLSSRESSNLHKKPKQSMECDTARAMKMFRDGQLTCNLCLKSEMDKTEKRWSLRNFFRILKIRILGHRVIDDHYEENEDILSVAHTCKLCGKISTDIRPLIALLLKEKQKHFRIAPVRRAIHQCRVCGIRYQALCLARKHIIEHINYNEVYYCSECQNTINDLTRETFTLPVSLISGDTPTLVGKASLLGTNCSGIDTTITPRCRNCGKIFDYIVPLIHKIVEFHLQISGSIESEITKTCSYYCQICSASSIEKDTIEVHALNHVLDRDILCKRCHGGKETKEVKSTREEEKLQESFLVILDSSDVEGDEQLLEAIKSCEWSFCAF